ncbi:hypothetical protein ISN70_004390, partial [Shigella sonnei]|nr:hypothetical protein [Shigella sonnei]
FHHRQVISRRFVVTRGDAAIFFQPPKAPFNDITIAVRITMNHGSLTAAN